MSQTSPQPPSQPLQKSPRRCPQCQRTEPEVSFYRLAEDCRTCIRDTVNEVGVVKMPLDLKVEKHRQEKMLRAELKKLAKKRMETRRVARTKRHQEAKIKAILPDIKHGEVDVDPATKEMALRTLQRRRLIEFVKEFHPKYKPGWVHVEICRKLEKFAEDVAAGKSPRLMILMPPRHGKSQIASKLFPAWFLGHHPDMEVIACSYNISLALDFSREVRGTIRSERFQTLFPTARLDRTNEGAESWKLGASKGTAAGGYVAAGIGGAINGKGAHVLVIDDPIKNAQEAGNVDHLRGIHEWYDSTAYTRLAPGGGVLIIQTWWSDNDLAGRVQQEMKDLENDQFEIVKYAAIATEDEEFRMKGEALHPERYPLPALIKIRNKQGGEKGKFWMALYQQNPTPDDGAMFTRDMFVYKAELPDVKVCYIYQAWDFAAGEKRYNDWTVGVTMAVDHEDTAHVLEVRRFRTQDQLKQATEIADMWARYPNVMTLGVEKGQIWAGIRAHLYKLLKERGAYPVIEELQPLVDKILRARPLQGRMQQHKVTFPNNASWIGDVQAELLRFPNGMHDDIVDAFSWCVTILLGKAPPRLPKADHHGRRDMTVAEKLRKFAMGGGGKGHMAA